MFVKQEFCDAVKSKKVYTKEFNIIDVARGSIHYDQELKDGRSFFGKLIFDVKMNQRVVFEVQINSLTCILKEAMVSRRYFYNYVLTVSLEGQSNNYRKHKFQDFREPAFCYFGKLDRPNRFQKFLQ